MKISYYPQLKTISFLCLLSLFSFNVFAQVGIGTTNPSTNSLLEIGDATTTTKGLLLPRVNLTGTANFVPMAAHVQGMVVYNKNTAGNVTPGYYYNDGTQWVRIGSSNGDWALLGNTNTTPGTSVGQNYLGTTDAKNLVFATAGAERAKISGTTGNTVIGTTTLPTDIKLEVSGGTNSGVFGHSDNVGGYLGKQGNITIGIPTQTMLGAGVYATNPTAGYTSVFAQSTGNATVAASINYSSVWIANYNYVQNASALYNPPASYSQLNITNSSLGGFQSDIKGYSDRGATSSNPAYTVGGNFTAIAKNQDAMGVIGSAFSDANIRIGGYFEGNNYTGTNNAYAYVGGTTNGVTNRKIVGTGTVSEIVPTKEYGRITLTCPESPEYWYQDYGDVRLVNGRATIQLDEILADVIVVDEQNPIRVTCTPVGMPYFNGVTIMKQTNNSVEILELNGGRHSGKLQYQIVVKPKTNYGEERFPQAPGPGYLKADKEPLAAKAKNQPNDGRKIFSWPADHIVYKYNPEDMVGIGDVVSGGPYTGKIKLGNGKYGEGMPFANPQKPVTSNQPIENKTGAIENQSQTPQIENTPILSNEKPNFPEELKDRN
ncbi:MAG: hypothetical protein JJE55_11650 [Flavobacteriaceae bacterium]|nr:hypothetical protein [Flavobacteriaceae bacterium]